MIPCGEKNTHILFIFHIRGKQWQRTAIDNAKATRLRVAFVLKKRLLNRSAPAI